MSILTWIEDKKRLKLLNAPKYVNRSADSSKGLWTRCDKCGVILYIKHLKENGRVCFGCSYHLQMMSRERIENLLDRVPAIFSSNPTSSENPQKGARSSKRQESFCKSSVQIFDLQSKAKQSTESAFSQKNPESRTRFNSRDSTVSSWRPLDETLSPCDPLTFHDQKRYRDRLKDAQERTGLQDAIQTGTGMIDGIPVALAVMDFSFMGGSMGSVVGEKITRLIEYATGEGLTLLIVSASGGARMQEGVFSLMQMAKISSALQIYQSCARLLYISILTSPTTGGVTASFAMLGDIIFAEPKALIAFAGRRVIEQTLAEDLPEDFQTSESMLHHGLVDLIVPRRFLRQAISETIRLYQNAPFKKIGVIPFGVQNPITFLTEEKVRRQWSTLTKKATKKHAIESKSLAKQVGFLSGGLARQSKAIGHHQEEMAKSSSRVVNPAPANLRSSAGLQAGTRHGAYREILTSFEMMLNLFQYGKVVKSNPTQMKTGEKPSFVSNGEGDNPLASANQTLSFVPGGESTLPREGGVSQGSLNLAEGKTKKKWGRDSLQNNCTPKGCKGCANLLAFSPYGGVRPATAENRFLQKPVKTAKWTDLLALSPIVLLRSRANFQFATCFLFEKTRSFASLKKARGCANRMCKSSVLCKSKICTECANRRFAKQSKAKQSTAKKEPGNMLSFKTLAFRNHGSFKAIAFRKICLFKAIAFKKRGNMRNHSYPEHKSERSSISRINGKGVSLHRIGLKKNLALPIMLRANLKRFGETGQEIGNRASHDLGLANPVQIFCANLRFAKQTSADPLARKDNRNGDHSVPYYHSLQPKGSVHNLARDLRRAPQPHHETGSILPSNGSTKAFCPKGKKERLFSRNMGGQKDFCSICKSNLQRLVYSYRTTQQRVAQKGHARQRGKKVGACKGRARTCNTCYQSFFPAWPRNEIDRFDLLHHFRSFSEGFRSNALLSSQSNKERNRFSRASKDARGPEIVDLATGNADIDFLNQAIELAATDSVEWRAFYIHQQLSENMGFLEDFLQQDYDSRERNGNLFFYKSICRTQKALNE